ncbi:MAG: Mur ligase family protein [Puniceicoccaceae bacterium]
MSLSENIPAAYKELLQQPVAVFGFGASGHAACNLLDKLGVKYMAYDERAGDEGSVGRAFDEAAARRHRLVLHSPAFRMDHPWIETALGEGCCVVSEIDFAQQLRRGPTLVVTGTNGKTTLQEFITFSLKRTGISAVAAGQNAYPLSRLAVHQELDGVTAVCELGPDYIRPLKEFRFDALFWTNFREDHLVDEAERRAAFDGFRRLMQLSPKAMFFLGDSVVAMSRELGRPLPEQVYTAREEDYPDWELPDRTAFATSIHRPALALFRRYWLEMGYSDSLLKSAAEHFEVRAHRLHVSTIIGKTAFWNDANSRNFAAVEAAMENFKTPVVWIGGGHFRGGNVDALIERIGSRLKGAVITGNAAWHLLPVLEDQKIPCQGCLNLNQAVEVAFDMAGGEVPVVYSPGFVPGEEYGDMMERGICFENAVLGLKHQKGSV